MWAREENDIAFIHFKFFFMQVIRFGIGLDVAMEKFDACISTIDMERHVLVKNTRSFTNSSKGYQQLYKWAQLQCSPNISVSYLMEATGIYHENLACYLHAHNCLVSVVLPNKAKKYKQALGLRSKTDSIDAKSLSRMICEQSLAAWVPISKSIYLLRGLTRQIQSITQDATSIKINCMHKPSQCIKTEMCLNAYGSN